MKLVRAVQTSKKSTFESKEIRSLVKLDFSRLLIHPALKRRLLKKISSVAYDTLHNRVVLKEICYSTPIVFPNENVIIVNVSTLLYCIIQFVTQMKGK